MIIPNTVQPSVKGAWIYGGGCGSHDKLVTPTAKNATDLKFYSP
jgi:hypothetical protein